MDYMNDQDVSYEYDQGPAVANLIDIEDEDRQIERVYNSVRPDVVRNEPPPPKRIQEDCRLEAQYSEGESDDDDTPRTRDFRHITHMLRQVEPHGIDETSFLKGDPANRPFTKEYAVLRKPDLNPESAEFKPTAEPTTPQMDKEAMKPRKAPRCRNMAMESLMRLRNLEAEMKAASKSPKMPNSPIPVSSRSSSVSVLTNEESQKQSELTREELHNLSTPEDPSPNRSANSTPKTKRSKDFVPSANTSKYYEKFSKLKKKDTSKVTDVRGQRPALNLLSGYIDVKLSEHGKAQPEHGMVQPENERLTV